jgi:hypothetical protein
MSFLRKITYNELWDAAIVVSSICGANYSVYKGIKQRTKTEYTDVIMDSIWGFMGGGVVGFFSPVIVSVGIISIPGYIAGNFKK